MLGAEGLTYLIVDRLRTALPAKMVELRARYTAGTADVPDVDPAMILPHELDMLSVDRFPAIFVLPQRTDPRGGAPARQADGFRDVFAFRYQVRIFTWVRGLDYEDTARRRDRLALAVREVVLARPQLTAWDVDQYALLDLRSWAESYSDVDRDTQTGRTLAGAYCEAFWQTQETLTAWQPTTAAPGGVELSLSMQVPVSP